MAVGERLPAELTRAAMAVRCNGLCAGGSGATPRDRRRTGSAAQRRRAPVHPPLRLGGSVGPLHAGPRRADPDRRGRGRARRPADGIGRRAGRAGLEPVALGPKDGLAICSSSAVSAGWPRWTSSTPPRAWRSCRWRRRCRWRAFAPTSARWIRAWSRPGRRRGRRGRPTGCARCWHGGALTEPGAARRLQDPLSLRCVSQIHGSLHVALDLLAAAVEPELGGAADNPLVLIDDEEILSTGNFHVPALALALDATAIALAQVAATSAERQARLKTERLSGLPGGLSPSAHLSSGLSPLSKTAQALTVEIRHLAAPLSIMPTIGADSVEDDSTGAAHAALRVREQIERMRLLAAIELIVAAQAVDLALGGHAPQSLGAGTAAAHAAVREWVAMVEEDRPVGPDVERLTADAAGGRAAARAGAAPRWVPT